MAKIRLRLWHKFELVAAIPLLSCACLFLFLAAVYTNSEKRIHDAERARQALNACESILATLSQTTGTVWTAVNRDQAQAVTLLARTEVKVRGKIRELKKACADYPNELKTAEGIETSAENAMQLLHRVITAKSKRGLRQAMQSNLALAEPQASSDLRQFNRDLEDQINARLNDPNISSAAAMMNPIIFGSMLLIIIAGVASAFVLNRNVVDRLTTLARNSERMARLESLTSPLGGEDEIADLDLALHATANSLTEAISRERAAVDNAADVICTVKSDGSVASVNSACYEAWGYANHEVEHRSLLELVDPADRDMTREFFSGKSIAPDMMTLENRLIRKDGKKIYVLWTCRRAERTDETFCIAHDITQRKLAQDKLKESEARFALIKQGMPAAMIIFDANGKIIECNSAASALTGRSTNELVSMDLRAIAPAIDAGNLLSTQWKAPQENELHLPDGTLRTADVVIDRIDIDGVEQFLSVWVDISERHELERIKETLVAMIAHDIATPLTTIQAHLHLTKAGAYGELTDEGQEAITAAQAHSDGLMGALTTLMKTAKYTHSEIVKGLSSVPLFELVDAALTKLTSELSTARISSKVFLNRSACVMADPDSVTHALSVVVAHAVQFCRPGEVLTCDVEPIVEAGRNLSRLSISALRKQDVTAPSNLSWEFACAILSENHGSLAFVEAGEQFRFLVELPTA